jgi:hypothetical protein
MIVFIVRKVGFKKKFIRAQNERQWNYKNVPLALALAP